MMSPMTEWSPMVLARMAGLFWLLTALTGTLALFAAGGALGTTSNFVATGCYIVATVLVYKLLKPVNRNLSLIAALASISGCVVGILSAVLNLKTGNIPTLFFGIHCLLVGYLVLRSTFMSRIVGVWMVIAGCGWLIQGSARLVLPSLANILSFYPMLAGIFGEVTLTLWLLVKGVDVQRWKEKASKSG